MGFFFNGKCRSKARLDGKVAIVTGSNTGIGKVTVLDFAKRGAKVIMACRDSKKAETAAEEIRKELKESDGQVVVYKLDLSSLESVKNFCEEFLRNESALHLLINNAGVMMCPHSLTVDGFENHIATNHLGHFLLTMTLLPTIIKSAPARIVNVSSKAHMFANTLSFDDFNLTKSYGTVYAYGRSKLSNILFTKELARRLKGTNVTVYSLHPGVVNTELSRNLDTAIFPGSRWFYETFGPLFIKSPLQGAQTSLYCALEEKVAEDSGLYYDDCQVVTPSRAARNEKLAKELWEKSVECVKLSPELDLPIKE